MLTRVPSLDLPGFQKALPHMLYTEIPSQRPVTPLLDAIDDPQQLRQLEQSQLPQVADEFASIYFVCCRTKWWAFWR